MMIQGVFQQNIFNPQKWPHNFSHKFKAIKSIFNQNIFNAISLGLKFGDRKTEIAIQPDVFIKLHKAIIY